MSQAQAFGRSSILQAHARFERDVEQTGPRQLRTADEYSNAVAQQRPERARAGHWRAHATRIDRPSTSSHRGGQGFKASQLHPEPQVKAVIRVLGDHGLDHLTVIRPSL
jgi:hypothetical protein